MSRRRGSYQKARLQWGSGMPWCAVADCHYGRIQPPTVNGCTINWLMHACQVVAFVQQPIPGELGEGAKARKGLEVGYHSQPIV